MALMPRDRSGRQRGVGNHAPAACRGGAAWLDAQAATDLWLTSTVAADLMFDVARLPDGARNQQFARSVSGMLERDFSGRVLPFDLVAASLLAELLARRSLRAIKSTSKGLALRSSIHVLPLRRRAHRGGSAWRAAPAKRKNAATSSTSSLMLISVPMSRRLITNTSETIDHGRDDLPVDQI